MQVPHARWAALLCALAFSAAFGHGTVESTSPRSGATLTTPPAEIRLQFNEAMEPAFTTIKLFDPSGQEVPTKEKARLENGKTAVLALPVLAPGSYRAEWKTVGHDGHRVHGTLGFTLK